MARKIIVALTVVAILVSVMSTGFSGSAVYENTVLYGDVNGDGKLDTEDAKEALKAASGVITITDGDAFARTDVNGDGFITIFDARQILRGVAGIISLQPDGAFSGIELEGGISLTEETAIVLFNEALNRVKTDVDGYAATIEKTEDEEFNEDSLSSDGKLTGAVLKLISGIIAGEDSDNEVTGINKGSQNYSLMSIEGSPYVSLLTVDDIYGLKSAYDLETGYITLQIAIPNSDVEAVTQSAYSRVLNAEIMVEETNQLLAKLAESVSNNTTRREFKNGVLTLVVDSTSANCDVVSYKIEYQSEMFISEAKISGISVKNLRFTKSHTIEYLFDWGAI